MLQWSFSGLSAFVWQSVCLPPIGWHSRIWSFYGCCAHLENCTNMEGNQPSFPELRKPSGLPVALQKCVEQPGNLPSGNFAEHPITRLALKNCAVLVDSKGFSIEIAQSLRDNHTSSTQKMCKSHSKACNMLHVLPSWPVPSRTDQYWFACMGYFFWKIKK